MLCLDLIEPLKFNSMLEVFMYLAVGGRRNTSPASLSNAKYSKATELFIWYSQRPREPFFADRMTAPSSIVLLSMSSARGSVLDWSNYNVCQTNCNANSLFLFYKSPGKLTVIKRVACIFKQSFSKQTYKQKSNLL